MLDKFKNPEFIRDYLENPKFEEIRAEYKRLYEESNIVPMPILFSKLRKFSECGERYSYEAVYNQHINKLQLTAYMAIFYGDEYLSDLEDCIYDVLNIYVWAISAHIPDINEENYYELDLVSTALGSSFAVIDYLIGHKLHPQLQKRIKTELKRRILDPFKEKIWHWEDRYNNWTSVCAGFTAITIMLEFPEEFDKLLPRFQLNMEKYFKGFPDDGVCLEGPGYWGYGFVSFLVYAMLLKEYTNGEIDFFTLDKTRKIAMFYQNTMLDKDVITSYGDCPIDVKTNPLLFHALKNIYGSDFIMPSKKSFASAPFSPIIHILYYIENYNPDAMEEELGPYECYMPNAGWYIKRTDSYSLGAKGGTNGESHNHNDVGSFILSKNNKQVLIDMGGRPYTKDYFVNEARYTYLEPSSRGHNVPIINGRCQANIRETRSYTSFENGVFSVDFKELYDIPELKSLVRHYKCLESSVIIKDVFKIDGKSSFISRLVSFDEPVINDGEIIVDSIKIRFNKNLAKGSYSTEVHTISQDAKTNSFNTRIAYLINIEALYPEKGELEITIEA